MSKPRTEAGRRLLAKLDQINRMPYANVSFPFADDAILAIEAEAALPVPALDAAVVMGFDPGVPEGDQTVFWAPPVPALDVSRRPYTAKIGMDALVVRADGSSINFGDAIYHPENAAEAEAYAVAALPVPAIDAALTFLRKRLVGVPPNVDAEDVWMASLLDEAEAIGQAALPVPALDARDALTLLGLIERGADEEGWASERTAAFVSKVRAALAQQEADHG